MPRWVLECASCKNEFLYSEIYETGNSLNDSFPLLVTKPELPNGGFSVRCPSCRETNVYQRHQLLYRVP
jgi:hypothetical protein